MENLPLRLVTALVRCIQVAICLVLILLSFAAFSQTGPGGVGSGSTSLLLWLDGQSVNADGTNPAVGSEVITWYDRSGNGVNVTRNTTNVATYSATGVTFNNTGYLNGSDATFPTGNSPRTVIVCASSPSTPTDDVFFFYGTANNNQSYGVLKIGTSNAVRNYFYNNDLNVANGWTPSGTLKIITATYASPTQTLYINNNTPPSTKNAGSVNTTLGAQGLQIGGWNSFTLYSQATIAEVILFNKVLNFAERLIVNNYLSAKYGLGLAAYDYYDNDNPSNGNYDYDVAGIGRATLAETSTDAWSSITRITNAGGMGNGEYFLWGHDKGAMVATTAGIPGTVTERLTRMWRASEVGDVGSVDISFDMTGFGPFSPSDLRLLVSPTDTDFTDGGDFVLSGAVSSGGNVYTFQGVTALTNDSRFTIGIANVPLPVELLGFEAHEDDGKVKLTWSTATEMNNDFFTIERSMDGRAFTLLARVSGAGSTSERHDYSLIDSKPYAGRSYYRLSQTDYDGTTKYFPLASVETSSAEVAFTVYPNPSDGKFVLQVDNAADGESLSVTVYELRGMQICYATVLKTVNQVNGSFSTTPPNRLPSGVYAVKFNYKGSVYTRKLVIR